DAIRCLERAVRELGEAGIRTSEGWMGGYLAEAHLAQGDLDRARRAAEAAGRGTTEAQYPDGLGAAQRGPGRRGLAAADPGGAAAPLAAAPTTSRAIGPQREVGCTSLWLAEAAHAGGRPEAAAAHLRDASTQLARLSRARLADRAATLAQRLGYGLPSPPS